MPFVLLEVVVDLDAGVADEARALVAVPGIVTAQLGVVDGSADVLELYPFGVALTGFVDHDGPEASADPVERSLGRHDYVALVGQSIARFADYAAYGRRCLHFDHDGT